MKKLIFTFICLFSVVPCWGRTIYVDVDSPNDPGTGSYEDPFRRIQVAIDDPCTIDGDTVIVAEGIYTGTGNRGIQFGNKAVTLRSSNPSDSNIVAATVIDCENYCCGFLFYNEDANSVVDGFTIRNGEGADVCGGGGICCFDSTPTISNCVFIDNWGTFGGGIDCSGAPTIINCTFINNETGRGYGGGIFCAAGSPTIINCTFIRNMRGSITVRHGSPRIIGCTFIDNMLGILNYWYGSPIITNCVFIGNHAGYGGIWNLGNSSPTITNCTFTGNEGLVYGGAMYCEDSSITTVANCIMWGDSAPNGPEICLRSGSPTVTVTYSDVQGGEASAHVEGSSTLNWGPGNIDADPCFADTSSAEPDEWDLHLQSQAGRWDPNSETWVIDANTSPCIDAGDPASPVGYEPFPNGGIINMGAYGGTAEASKSYFGTTPCQTIVAGDINGDCKVDFKDFALMAFHWLESR